MEGDSVSPFKAVPPTLDMAILVLDSDGTKYYKRPKVTSCTIRKCSNSLTKYFLNFKKTVSDIKTLNFISFVIENSSVDSGGLIC